MAPRQNGWAVAGLAGVGIVAYFAFATVWLPSWVLRMPAVEQASRTVSDLVAILVWAVFLVLGMWGLRVAQRKGWI